MTTQRFACITATMKFMISAKTFVDRGSKYLWERNILVRSWQRFQRAWSLCYKHTVKKQYQRELHRNTNEIQSQKSITDMQPVTQQTAYLCILAYYTVVPVGTAYGQTLRIYKLSNDCDRYCEFSQLHTSNCDFYRQKDKLKNSKVLPTRWTLQVVILLRFLNCYDC